MVEIGQQQKYPDLSGELRRGLQQAIASVQADINVFQVVIDEGVPPPIPLKLLPYQQSLRFVSGVAFRLEKQWQQSALAIAHQLKVALNIPAEIGATAEWLPIWSELETGIEPPGWIVLQIRDPGIAAWLQWLASSSWNPPQTPGDLGAEPCDRTWKVQAAHARCCSLLRLATAQGIVTMSGGSHLWDLTQPQPVPWLQIGGSLRLHNPSERQLITQLVHTSEYFGDPDNSTSRGKKMLRQGERLARTFRHFDAACRIFGEVQRQQRLLSQSRLGLVLATRNSLYWLLVYQLGRPAPTTL